MFGREGDPLENIRRHRRAQYATDIQHQAGDTNRSTFRTSGAQQIVGFRQPDPRQPQAMMNTSGYSEAPQPSYEGGNQKMEFLMERMLAFELPLKMKPIQESVNALTAKIETINNSNQMAISAMKDKVTEIGFNINSINEKAAENKEKVQHMINDLYQNNQRTRDFAENTASRLAALEGRFSQLEDMLRGMSEKQQQFEQNIADQMNKLNMGLQNLGRTSADNDRNLAGQMESLNRETQATFGAMGRQIQSVSAVMVESMNQLAMATRESLEVVRSDNDDAIANVERQLEQTSAETAQAINQLERDVIDTFSTTLGLVNSSHAALENALKSESAVRKRNDEKMMESQGVFTVAIAGQVANNTKAIERIEEGVKGRVEQVCTAYLSTWKNDLSEYLNEVSNAIGDCQTRTADMEQQLTDYIVAVGRRQDEIMALVKPKAKLSELPEVPEIRKTPRLETPKFQSSEPKMTGLTQGPYRPPVVQKSQIGNLSVFAPPPATDPQPETPEVIPVGLKEDPPLERETPTEPESEIPFDERPIKPMKDNEIPEYPDDERPIKPMKDDQIPEYPEDERPIKPMKNNPIPEYEDEPSGPLMGIVSNGMVFRRPPNPKNSNNGQPVTVYIAEPRVPKQGMGMVLALHGRHHSGRPHKSKRDSMRRQDDDSATPEPSPAKRQPPKPKVGRQGPTKVSPPRRQPPPDEPSMDFAIFQDEPSLAECAFLSDGMEGSPAKRRKRQTTKKRA